jgi:3-methyladenine DNA glycosylase/8-oxoguanine DNA glycosylase
MALSRRQARRRRTPHGSDEDETVELTERWRPYRSLAVSYLFASEYDGGNTMELDDRTTVGIIGAGRLG